MGGGWCNASGVADWLGPIESASRRRRRLVVGADQLMAAAASTAINSPCLETAKKKINKEKKVKQTRTTTTVAFPGFSLVVFFVCRFDSVLPSLNGLTRVTLLSAFVMGLG